MNVWMRRTAEKIARLCSALAGHGSETSSAVQIVKVRVWRGAPIGFIFTIKEPLNYRASDFCLRYDVELHETDGKLWS